MKRLTNTILLLILLVASVAAQDFKLYYAKNVTDVTEFRNLTEMSKQLHWREVTNGSVDTNRDDVIRVKAMLSETRMKGLEDQQLFWKMRDEMLLCFRIDDTGAKSGSFRVEVIYGKTADGDDIKKTLTTRKYFFANMPLGCDEVSINVYRVKDPTQRINFRYSVFDWDDEHVYLFQLDQKRQSTGDTYKMEYVTAYADEEGEIHSQSQVLELKETKFQSFYVPEGHTLTDVYFLTGNDKEGDVKLRMDMNEIHPTIDIDNQLEAISLTPTFKLAKHENREMMNFNWVGTGLFEKYDTLYIKLFDNKSKSIAGATMRVQRVDENGNKVDDNSLKFEGYDSHSKQYKVLTYGHPAYIEILHDNFLPLLYRYKGAADATSKIVSADLCSAKITMKSGKVAEYKNSIAVSDLYFRYMKDEAISIARKNDKGETVHYAVMTLDEDNISGKGATDMVTFTDNGGNDYPKLLDNKPIEKFAQLEVAFSAPPGSGGTQCKLTVKEEESQASQEATAAETNVVTGFGFTRDYYFARYDMTKLPRNQQCNLTLSTPSFTYKQFPPFLNRYIDEEKEQEESEKQAKQMVSVKDEENKTADGLIGLDLGFNVPLDFKLSFGDHFVLKFGAMADFKKQMCNFFINATLNFEPISPTTPKWQGINDRARENAKQVQDYRMCKMRGNDNAKIAGSNYKMNFDDWMLTEMESIFEVQAKHIGNYFQGGGNFMLRSPLKVWTRPPQIAEASLFAQFGYGFFWSLDNMVGKLRTFKETVENWLPKKALTFEFGIQFDANVRLEGGIKSFTAKKKDKFEWSDEAMGAYANISGNLIFGAWASIRTRNIFVVNADISLRAGAKVNAAFGWANSFSEIDGWGNIGGHVMLIAGGQLSIAIRSLIGHVGVHPSIRVGHDFLWPDDATNPFHPKFPYWLPDEDKIGLRMPQFSPLRAPEANDFGQLLARNVRYDANPHFIDENHVVYNSPGNDNDYNNDHIALATVANGSAVSTEPLSTLGTSASQQARSQRGDKEVVVYQQTTQTVDQAAVTNENAAKTEIAAQEHTQIKAAFRQGDGTWKQTVVTPDDGFIDKNPMISVQEDGKAAVVYQHGKSKIIDETESADSINNYKFEGELLLRTYDPTTGWSEPKNVWYYNDISWPLKYDLIMRNDSVLVAAMLEEPSNPVIGAFAGKYTRYGWTTTKMDQMFYTHEDLHAVDFCLSRVGEHGVMAMLYERPDSTREIYIKTVKMDGTDDGLAGADLGIGRTMPYKLKIISDRDDNQTDDFAILWTEQSNFARDAENGNKELKDYYTVLNGSRIHLSDGTHITYPLTLGVERDSLQMGYFDGYLDDARMEVVYTLTEPSTNETFIMHNDKEFTNSFESDVTYSREALLGSSTLPVNVDIMNTGTSAIKAATVTINGDAIAIPDVLVQPMQQQRYVVQYPIPEDFDGYMQSTVEVEYANIFKAKQQTGRRVAPRNLLRQRRAFPRNRVSAGSIDCNVINHSVEDGVNKFVVEIVDYSSRGLTPGTAIQVGAYVHPSTMEVVSSEAATLVHAEDFTRMGGVRKAYAEVTVSGITEKIDGYIAAHIVDTEINTDDETENRILNTCATSGPSYVIFHPTGEATSIDNPVVERPKDHRVSVIAQEGGVLLGNLEPGEDVRVFSSEGITVHMERPASNTLFVPLNSHGVFILSVGKEVFKFTY